MQKLNLDVPGVTLMKRRNASDILYVDISKELSEDVLKETGAPVRELYFKLCVPKGTGKKVADALGLKIDEVLER